MVLHRLTDNDHAALREAVELVRSVIDRHPEEMKLTIEGYFGVMMRSVHAIEVSLDEEEAA